MACSIMIKDQEHKMGPEPGLHYKSQKSIFSDRALIDISYNIEKKKNYHHWDWVLALQALVRPFKFKL